MLRAAVCLDGVATPGHPFNQISSLSLPEDAQKEKKEEKKNKYKKTPFFLFFPFCPLSLPLSPPPPPLTLSPLSLIVYRLLSNYFTAPSPPAWGEVTSSEGRTPYSARYNSARFPLPSAAVKVTLQLKHFAHLFVNI